MFDSVCLFINAFILLSDFLFGYVGVCVNHAFLLGIVCFYIGFDYSCLLWLCSHVFQNPFLFVLKLLRIVKYFFMCIYVNFLFV